MTVDLKGKWALVTGASRGIGMQVARGLAAKGCQLVLHSRMPENTKSLATELERLGAKVISLGAELSDENSLVAMVDEALSFPSGTAA